MNYAMELVRSARFCLTNTDVGEARRLLDVAREWLYSDVGSATRLTPAEMAEARLELHQLANEIQRDICSKWIADNHSDFASGGVR